MGYRSAVFAEYEPMSVIDAGPSSRYGRRRKKTNTKAAHGQNLRASEQTRRDRRSAPGGMMRANDAHDEC